MQPLQLERVAKLVDGAKQLPGQARAVYSNKAGQAIRRCRATRSIFELLPPQVVRPKTQVLSTVPSVIDILLIALVPAELDALQASLLMLLVTAPSPASTAAAGSAAGSTGPQAAPSTASNTGLAGVIAGRLQALGACPHIRMEVLNACEGAVGMQMRNLRQHSDPLVAAAAKGAVDGWRRSVARNTLANTAGG